MRKVILFTLCIFFSLYSCVDDEDFVIENLSSQDLVACHRQSLIYFDNYILYLSILLKKEEKKKILDNLTLGLVPYIQLLLST